MVTSTIVIKVAALYKISYQAQRFRRSEIDGNKLKRMPLFALIPVFIFIIVWTTFDMPRKIEILSLRGRLENVVVVKDFCSSSSNLWSLLAFFWQLTILMTGCVLALLSSQFRNPLAEGQSLTLLVFSQSVFLALRAIAVLTTSTSKIAQLSCRSHILSIITSLDVIASICIYIGPKLTKLSNSVDNSLTGSKSFRNDRSSISYKSNRNDRNSISYKSKNRSIREPELHNSFKLIVKTFDIQVDEEDDSPETNGFMQLRRSGVSLINANQLDIVK